MSIEAVPVSEIDNELHDLRAHRDALMFELGQVNEDIAALELARHSVVSGDARVVSVEPKLIQPENPELYAFLNGRPVRVLFDGVNGR